MQDTLVIKQELTFKEFLLSIFYIYVKKNLQKILLGLLFVLIISILLMPHEGTSSQDYFYMTGYILLVFSIGFFSFLLLILFLCWLLYRKNNALLKNISLSFTHWGLTREGGNYNLSIPWRDIVSFKETEAFFIIYIITGLGITVQKRMLKDAAAINDCRNFLLEHTQK